MVVPGDKSRGTYQDLGIWREAPQLAKLVEVLGRLECQSARKPTPAMGPSRERD